MKTGIWLSFFFFMATQSAYSQVDIDQDGIFNFSDIDDDNDGVLDATESPSCFMSATEWNTANSITQIINLCR